MGRVEVTETSTLLSKWHKRALEKGLVLEKYPKKMSAEERQQRIAELESMISSTLEGQKNEKEKDLKTEYDFLRKIGVEVDKIEGKQIDKSKNNSNFWDQFPIYKGPPQQTSVNNISEVWRKRDPFVQFGGYAEPINKDSSFWDQFADGSHIYKGKISGITIQNIKQYSSIVIDTGLVVIGFGLAFMVLKILYGISKIIEAYAQKKMNEVKIKDNSQTFKDK